MNDLSPETPLSVLTFNVDGEPKPEKRPRWARRTGHMHRDRSADGWKHATRAAAVLAVIESGWPAPVDGTVPLGVDLVFRFERPAGHYQKGAQRASLRAGAPIFHVGTPDRDNAQKAILDGLGRFDGLPSLLWADDKQVAAGVVVKRYADPGELPGVLITIYPLIVPMRDRPASLSLTNGESWWIDRRRAGLSIDGAAALLGVSAHAYRAWETGDRTGPKRELKTITAGEWCAVLRARHNLTRSELAQLTGLGTKWIDEAELGHVDPAPLVAWWQRYLRNLQRAYTEAPGLTEGEHGVVRELPRPRLDDRPRPPVSERD